MGVITAPSAISRQFLKLTIQNYEDLTNIRQQVHSLARELEFRATAQVQIVTAVSEIVRNVLM